MDTGERFATRQQIATWEALFSLIRDHWSTVQVERWACDFAVVKAEYALLRFHGLWKEPLADFFSVVGVSRRELQHSRMLKWLLDPGKGHGLAVGFVAKMLQLCGSDVEPEHLHVCSVRHEETRGTRDGQETRADVVVQGEARGESFVLVIENKVDAREGQDQCDRLYECFEEEGAHFMFLSPAREPTTDTAKKFVSVRYWQVSRALEEALVAAPEAADRSLAENYLWTLRREFG